MNATFDGHATIAPGLRPRRHVTALETTSLATRTYAVKFLPTKCASRPWPRTPGTFVGGFGDPAWPCCTPAEPGGSVSQGSVCRWCHRRGGGVCDAQVVPVHRHLHRRPIFRYDSTKPWSTGRTRRRSPRSAPQPTGPGPRLGNSREPDLLRDVPEVRRARPSPRDHRPRRGTAPRRQSPVSGQSVVSLAAAECRVRRNLSLGRARVTPTQTTAKCLPTTPSRTASCGSGPRPGRGLRRRGLGTHRNRLSCQRDHPRRALRRHRGGVAPVILQTQRAQTTPVLRNAALTFSDVDSTCRRGPAVPLRPGHSPDRHPRGLGITTPQLVVQPGRLLLPMARAPRDPHQLSELEAWS